MEFQPWQPGPAERCLDHENGLFWVERTTCDDDDHSQWEIGFSCGVTFGLDVSFSY